MPSISSSLMSTTALPNVQNKKQVRQSLRQWIALFCYPPWPSSIASKLAFLPPRPATYDIIGSGGGYQIRQKGGTTLDSRIFEPFFIKTKHRNNICCLFVRINPAARFTIVHSHGNAVDLGVMAYFYMQLGRSLGCNVIGYDYSGYGASTGRPSERNVYADVEAVYRAVLTSYNLKPSNVILYGQSIGTVPTVYLASKTARDVAAVVLHSPLTTGMEVACPWLKKTPAKRCIGCCDMFKSIERVNRIEALTLVIHGEQDEVVHVRHGFSIFEGLKNPARPLWVPEAGHNDIELYPAYSERLKTFVDQEIPSHCLSSSSSSPQSDPIY